ncbi:MAG: hypothetical protein HY738_12390 [Bacteroidia bacterium]|nr:hypothetical protein [Bacteroidia bacterium]
MKRKFIKDFGAVWRSPIGYISKKTRFCGNYFLVTKDEKMYYLWALDMTDPDSGTYILLKKSDCSTQLVDEGQKLDDEIWRERVRKGEYF